MLECKITPVGLRLVWKQNAPMVLSKRYLNWRIRIKGFWTSGAQTQQAANTKSKQVHLSHLWNVTSQFTKTIIPRKGPSVCHSLAPRSLACSSISAESESEITTLSSISLCKFGKKLIIKEGWRRMPGVRGPSDYSREPPRHPSLQINAKASLFFFFFFFCNSIQFHFFDSIWIHIQNQSINCRNLSMRSHRVQLWFRRTWLLWISSTRGTTVLFQ